MLNISRILKNDIRISRPVQWDGNGQTVVVGGLLVEQSNGEKVGRFCAPLVVLMAVIVLGLVAVYACNCYWRNTAEKAAVAGVESLIKDGGGDVLVHLEPAPAWGNALNSRMDYAMGESVHFKTNFHREKRQQQAAIAGEEGCVFEASKPEGMDISGDKARQADEAAAIVAGATSKGMHSVCAGRRAFVTVKRDNGINFIVSDEIDCYAYAVCMSRIVPMTTFLLKEGVVLEYTALATASVRKDLRE